MPPCSPPSDPFNLFSITGLFSFFHPLTSHQCFSAFLSSISSPFCSLMSSEPFCLFSVLSAINGHAFFASFCLIWCLILYLFYVSLWYLFSSFFLPFLSTYISQSFRLPLPLISGFPSFSSPLPLLRSNSR